MNKRIKDWFCHNWKIARKLGWSVIVPVIIALIGIVLKCVMKTPLNYAPLALYIIAILIFLHFFLTEKKESTNMEIFLETLVRKIYIPITFFLIPYIISFIDLLLASNETTPFYSLYEQAKEMPTVIWYSIACTAFGIFVILSKKMSEDNNKVKEMLARKLDKIINNANITFEAGINEFDDKHLFAMYRILIGLKEEQEKTENQDKVFNIYAIDNSDPRTWWSDTMIGYLALISNKVPVSNVHRIFIHQKNELLSPIFVKTVGLHSLMGYKTYIIETQKYKKILDEILKKNESEPKYDIEKEVFIWTKKNKNGDIRELGDSFPISFRLDELDCAKKWTNVRCYQSFWKADSEYNDRIGFPKKDTLKNYYGNNINSKSIRILFEFISNEKESDASNPEKYTHHKDLPTQYLELIKALLDKMICCKNVSEVPNNLCDNYYGIEIKTGQCFNEDKTVVPSTKTPKSSRCVPKSSTNQDGCINYTVNDDFDFTTMNSIKEILEKYYDNLNEENNEVRKAQIN